MEPARPPTPSAHWVIQPDESNCYGLMISTLRFANQAQNYPKFNIKAVLSALKSYGAFTQVSVPKQIIHKQIQIDDDDEQFITPHIESSNEFIRTNLTKGNVLVHCQAGVSRSASFVIAYLMERFGLGYHEAFKMLRGRRPQVDPNDGFVRQLKGYDDVLKIKRENLKKSMM